MAFPNDINGMSSPGEMERHSFPPPSQDETSSTNVDRATSPATSSTEKDPDKDQLAHAFRELVVQEQEEEQLPMAERMFTSLAATFQDAGDTHKINLSSPDWHNRLRRADENSRQGIRDIEILRWIRTVLDQLRLLDSEHLVKAAKILANASRDDVNREIAIALEYIQPIIGHLDNSEVVEITISVIYNICNNYERAQHAFRAKGLCPALVNVLFDIPFEPAALLPYICALLDFSSQQSDLTACPEHSLKTIMRLLRETEADPSDLLLIISTVNAFLRQERFQRQFVDRGLVNILLDLIARTYTQEIEGPEAEEALSFLRNSINQTLSDISATSLFANQYPMNSRLVGSLIGWLASTRAQMRICACLVLGNLARSDPVCLEMVRQLRLDATLFQMLRDQSDMQAAYAALGFLRNLALPAENKQIIGSLQSMELISSFWSLDFNAQVQHASVALLRQLLNGCIGNVRWLLESLSPDQDSPAHEKTYLSLLLLLFGRTDDVSTKVEIGRTVATICRCIASSSQGLPPESTSAILHRLYEMHADIARPLAMMITQNRFLIIRSEGWFALALMARSKEGSTAVSEVLQQMEVFGALVSTVTGQAINGHGNPNTSSTDSEPPSEQERDMQAKDRENALVLINELLKNTGDEMSVIRRSILEDLMRGPQSPEGAQELMTRAQSEDGAE
ncbi:MAG: hypothetical protein Q9184_005685 [Pyrenodesmia sp. 2 TL-2023]